MNGAECGECGHIQCKCDRFYEKLSYDFDTLDDYHYEMDYKIKTALKIIAKVLCRIEQKGKLGDAELGSLHKALKSLVETKKRWKIWRPK